MTMTCEDKVKLTKDPIKISLLVSMVIIFLLVLAILFQSLQKTTVQGFAVIETSAGHIMDVTKIDSNKLPLSTAQLKTDLGNYVALRESLNARNMADIKLWMQAVNWRSDDAVYSKFTTSLGMNDGLIAKCGTQGYAVAKVDSISLISDENNKYTTALVDFTQTIVDKSGNKKVKHLRATMSWRYTGTPENYQIALNNWSGFEVVRYDISEL